MPSTTIVVSQPAEVCRRNLAMPPEALRKSTEPVIVKVGAYVLMATAEGVYCRPEIEKTFSVGGGGGGLTVPGVVLPSLLQLRENAYRQHMTQMVISLNMA
jgi:hypothetical protein